MRDHPLRTDKPLIYHLDVAAMYPNIMLSSATRSLMRPRAPCATSTGRATGI
jgi:hypothetical protein